MDIVLSNVISLFPAKSISNNCGASAANEAKDTLPLFPALAWTAICVLLYWAVEFDPVGQMIISKFLIFEASVFLNRISSTTLAFVAPVATKVSVFIDNPEAR